MERKEQWVKERGRKEAKKRKEEERKREGKWWNEGREEGGKEERNGEGRDGNGKEKEGVGGGERRKRDLAWASFQGLELTTKCRLIQAQQGLLELELLPFVCSIPLKLEWRLSLDNMQSCRWLRHHSSESIPLWLSLMQSWGSVKPRDQGHNGANFLLLYAKVSTRPALWIHFRDGFLGILGGDFSNFHRLNPIASIGHAANIWIWIRESQGATNPKITHGLPMRAAWAESPSFDTRRAASFQSKRRYFFFKKGKGHGRCGDFEMAVVMSHFPSIPWSHYLMEEFKAMPLCHKICPVKISENQVLAVSNEQVRSLRRWLQHCRPWVTWALYLTVIGFSHKLISSHQGKTSNISDLSLMSPSL